MKSLTLRCMHTLLFSLSFLRSRWIIRPTGRPIKKRQNEGSGMVEKRSSNRCMIPVGLLQCCCFEDPLFNSFSGLFFQAYNNYTGTSDWHHIFEVLDVPNQKPCVMLHVVHHQEIRPTDIIITRQSLTWDRPMAQYNYVFHLGLKVPDMIHNIIPPIFFRHTVILVPKVASYFSDLHGEMGCEYSM